MSRSPATECDADDPHSRGRYNWQPLFDILSGSESPPSTASVAASHGVNARTLQRRWRKYRAALAAGDELGLATARGEVDGRRDNARVFSREEEQELMEALSKENVHPNKPVVRALALRIHKAHEEEFGPAQHTKSQGGAVAPFAAGDAFVQRFKVEHKLSDKRVKIRRRHKRKQTPEAEEKKEADATSYLEDVVEAVKEFGAAYTINADEISGKLISPPRTLWAPINSPPPSISSNHTEKEAFTLIPRHDCGGPQAASCLLRAGQH